MEETTKIKDLTPESRRVNVLAKVVSKGEPKQIQTRFGEEKSVTGSPSEGVLVLGFTHVKLFVDF